MINGLIYRTFRLDRTNVVQSTFAKWALTQQLRQAGVLNAKETLDEHPQFMFLYRNGKLSHDSANPKISADLRFTQFGRTTPMLSRRLTQALVPSRPTTPVRVDEPMKVSCRMVSIL